MYYPIYRYTVRFIAINIAVYTVDKYASRYQFRCCSHRWRFDWNRIEEIAATMLENITNQVASNQDISSLGISTLGIPLTGSMSALQLVL
jgi:hypothetical protein